MLNTQKFVENLADEGYTHLCVVPCSFAKNLINASINNSDKLTYTPCASEAVACSVAAGLKMSGKRPIVVVQSSGLTNMGSCITSLLVPYNVYFPIIVSWRTYKEGGSEVQHSHLATRLPDLVDAYGYSHVVLDQENKDIAVEQIKSCEQQAVICLLKKDTFSPVSLQCDELDLSEYPKRSEYLKVLNQRYSKTDTIFIGTTGNTAREMGEYMPETSNFYMAGNMGGALSVGLGAALAGHQVFVCGGDAEFVMHMGGLTTVGRYGNENTSLVYVLFDNESNKSTGGQKTYQEHVDYIGIAGASGLGVHNETIDSIDSFFSVIRSIDRKKGVYFLHVKVSYDKESTRPSAGTIINSATIF
jgi:sulfopyruvate decarboxylase